MGAMLHSARVSGGVASAVCACVLGGLLPGRGSWSFPGCGGDCGLCLKLVGRRACASRYEVSPAGKLQCHFTCGFDFRHNV